MYHSRTAVRHEVGEKGKEIGAHISDHYSALGVDTNKGGRERSAVPRCRGMAIKDSGEGAYVATKGISQAHKHGQPRQRQPTFHVADERVIRVDQRGELLLREATREAESAQVSTEDDAVAFAWRCGGTRSFH